MATSTAPSMSPSLSKSTARLARAGPCSESRSRQITNDCFAPFISCSASRRTPRLNQAIALDGSRAIALLKQSRAEAWSPVRCAASPWLIKVSTSIDELSLTSSLTWISGSESVSVIALSGIEMTFFTTSASDDIIVSVISAAASSGSVVESSSCSDMV